MSSPNARDARPKRERIVINIDQPQKGARIIRPDRRGPKILAIIAIVCAVLLAGLGAGGYFWWQHYKIGPAYSLALLLDAARRNDMAAFDEIADTNRIVDNFVPQLTGKASEQFGVMLTPARRRQLEPLVPKVLPRVKQNVHEEVVRQVKELAARAVGKPLFLVALVMPYFTRIAEEGDTAKVTVNLKDHPAELTMQRNGTRWKVVAVKDDALAKRMMDNIVGRGIINLGAGF